MISFDTLLKHSKKKHHSLTSYQNEYDDIPVMFKIGRKLGVKQNYFKVGRDLAVKKVEKHHVGEKESEANNLLLAKSLNLGYYLITPLLLGILIGNWLDSVFRTKPIFLLSLFSLGIVGAFYNLWKVARESK